MNNKKNKLPLWYDNITTFTKSTSGSNVLDSYKSKKYQTSIKQVSKYYKPICPVYGF